MNREQAKEICEIIETHGIEIIKAYGEGKTIQHLNLDGEWIDCDMPISFSNNHSYRVKPEEADLSCNCKGCKYISLESVDEPCCNCINSDKYEKSEEKHYRPFKDSFELIETFQKKCDEEWDCKIIYPRLYNPCIWVREKETERESLIVEFVPYGISLGGYIDRISLYDLYEDFTFLDRSICGTTE